MPISTTPITRNSRRLTLVRLKVFLGQRTTKGPPEACSANTWAAPTTYLPLIVSARWLSMSPCRVALDSVVARLVSAVSARLVWNGTPGRLVSNNFLAAAGGRIGEQL